MKKHWTWAACILLGLLSSCQKEETGQENDPGFLHLKIGMGILISEEEGTLKATQGVEDFRVIIYDSQGTPVLTFDRAGDIPAQIELAPGQYYVEANSGNDLPAEFENPYYQGISDPFSISSNAEETVQVLCELANTMVSVQYSENVTGGFLDYSTTVSSQLGSLVFGMTETRMGYFRTLPLGIRVDLSYVDGDGNIPVSYTHLRAHET